MEASGAEPVFVYTINNKNVYSKKNYINNSIYQSFNEFLNNIIFEYSNIDQNIDILFYSYIKSILFRNFNEIYYYDISVQISLSCVLAYIIKFPSIYMDWNRVWYIDENDKEKIKSLIITAIKYKNNQIDSINENEIKELKNFFSDDIMTNIMECKTILYGNL